MRRYLVMEHAAHAVKRNDDQLRIMVPHGNITSRTG
jgi:hypothetical protein